MTLDNWKQKRVKEIGEIITGRTPSTARKEFYGGDCNLISPADLDNGKYVKTAHKRLTRLGLEQCRALPQNTVLVGCIGNVGKLGMVGDENSATNQQINALICNSENDPSFVYYCFCANKERLQQAAVKTTVPILNKTSFGNFELCVPPFPEQKKIAHILSTVQRAIDEQERIIQTTTELKKALMQKLFTEGLRGEPQKETEIGLVPESWEVVPLGEVAIIQTGIAKGRKVPPEEAIELPYLRVANVQDGYLDLAEMKSITIRKNEMGRYALKEGDVVLTEGGDLDKLGRGFIWHAQIESCVHQNYIFAVRPETTRLLSGFFAYQSQSPYGKRYFLSVAHKTTNLACINTTKLKAFPVLLPPMPEQQEIVGACSSIDEKIKVARNQKRTLESLFRSLLHELMTAKTRVTDCNSRDII
jgi:type I restriction enzyme, S subunit